MKKFMILVTTVAILASCSKDDEKVDVKDYGMKTFSANMKYEPSGGMASDFTYKQQTYFKFGEKEAVAVGEYGKGDWTTFDVLPKIPKEEGGELIDNPKYNVTTTVKNWNLVFTQYKGDAMQGAGKTVMPYFLTGVLINTENVEIALYEYKESTEEAKITKAFSDFKLSNATSLTYSNKIESIGIKWKKMKGMPPTYMVKTNYFYVAKLKDGNFYKLRFISFYGETKTKRIIKIEYALM